MKKMRGGDYMEPNKELKFGAAKGPKPKVKNNRRRAQLSTGPEDKKSTASKAQFRTGSDIAADTRAAFKSAGERLGEVFGSGSTKNNSSSEKSGREVDSKGNQIYGTSEERKQIKSTQAKTKSNPYSAAKKKDANLDSYIKARNSATKGSNEYNDAQNKINRAYGKGPTDRRTTYGPEKKGQAAPDSAKRLGPPKNSEAKPTLQMNMTSTKTPAAKSPTKKESRQTGRAAMKDRRQSARSKKAAAKEANTGESRKVQRAAGKMAKANVKGNTAKSDRAVDRFTKAKGRESERAANQQSRADKRDSKQFDRNERKGAKVDRKNRLADIKANKKSELKAARGKAKMGGPRRKAVTGMAVQAAGAGLQGIGKLTNAIAGKETKFGKIADAAGSTAVTAGGMMGGIPGAQTALDAAKGAIPTPGGDGAAGAGAVTPPSAPAVDPTQQPDPNAQPQARYGRTKALKDRRSKAKKGRYKAQMGTNVKGKDNLTPRQREAQRQFRKENSEQISRAKKAGNLGGTSIPKKKKGKDE